MIINEIIMATIRANYGQNVNIPKMVGKLKNHTKLQITINFAAVLLLIFWSLLQVR